MAHTSRRRSAVKNTGSYLPESPPALIALHRQTGPGKGILGRLLTDESMRPTWRALSKRIEHDRQWRELWGEIAYALRLTKLDRPELNRRRKACKRIAAAASRLADLIEGGALDLRVYELFGDQVMLINGVDGWDNLDSLQRSDRAHRLLREWPTTAEFLRELAVKARQSALDVMRTVPVERTTRDRKAIIFCRKLSAYFVRRLKAPLHATVAAIATVVLSRNVTQDFVEQVYRRRKKQK